MTDIVVITGALWKQSTSVMVGEGGEEEFCDQVPCQDGSISLF